MNLVIFSLVCLVTLLDTSAASNEIASQTGHGYQTNVSGCINLNRIPGVKELGINAEFCGIIDLESCVNHVKVFLQYNENTIVDVEVDGNAPTCEAYGSGAAECNYCIQLDTGSHFSSTYAKVCPKVTLSCLGGVVTQKIPIFSQDCYILGSQCDGASCLDCMADTNCGWCNTTNKCVAFGPGNKPDCTTCPGDDNQWLDNIKTCDGWAALHAKTDNSGPSKSTIAISVSAVVGVIAIAVLVIVVIKYRRRQTALDGTKHERVDPEARRPLTSQPDSAEMGDYAQLADTEVKMDTPAIEGTEEP